MGQVDLWFEGVAPRTELRKWFSHDPSRWTEFQARYRQAFRSKADILADLKEKTDKVPVTLLCGAKDEMHNEAVVLQTLLQPRCKVLVEASWPLSRSGYSSLDGDFFPDR